MDSTQKINFGIFIVVIVESIVIIFINVGSNIGIRVIKAERTL